MLNNPIRKFEKIGNWSRNHGFKEQDRKLLASEAFVKKVLDAWEDCPYVFDIYLLNSPTTNKEGFREQGDISKGIDKDYSVLIDMGLRFEPDAINLVYVGNYGAEKIPFTSWIMAHRAGHALRKDQHYNNKPFYTKLLGHCRKTFDFILKECQILNSYSYLTEYSKEKHYKYLATQIGTTAACRNNKLRNWHEFVFDLVAQYIVTGRIRLKPLSNRIVVGVGTFGRKDTYVVSNSALEKINNRIESLEDDLNEFLIPDWLEDSVGKIFLM